MRIAVVGATGRVGRPTVAALDRTGHEPVEISRSRPRTSLPGTEARLSKTTFEEWLAAGGPAGR
jgi:uncharacterized protein YbjT (DUF2867 family)